MFLSMLVGNNLDVNFTYDQSLVELGGGAYGKLIDVLIWPLSKSSAP